MTPNVIIMVMLVAGLFLIVMGIHKEPKASFDDGSFLMAILLCGFGAALILAALTWKFVLSFIT